jgi:outer membrane protein OmpA-like peptidoglycan-associated protein
MMSAVRSTAPATSGANADRPELRARTAGSAEGDRPARYLAGSVGPSARAALRPLDGADRAGVAVAELRPSQGGLLRGCNHAERPQIQRCGIGSSCDCSEQDKLAGVGRDLQRAAAEGFILTNAEIPPGSAAARSASKRLRPSQQPIGRRPLTTASSQHAEREIGEGVLGAARPSAVPLQRACACDGGGGGCHCDPKEQPAGGAARTYEVNRARGGGAPPVGGPEVTAGVREILNTSGTPLDPIIRNEMEPRFGADFSGVRIHTGPQAARSASSVNALAYTVGRHIVFGHDHFAPHTHGSKRVLAHELAHVVQQSQGVVSGSPTADASLSISDPSDPFEREADFIASQVTMRSSEPAGQMPLSFSATSAQRDAQGGPLFLQRAGGTPLVPSASDCTVMAPVSAVPGERFEYEFADTRLRPGEEDRIRAMVAALAPDEELAIHGFASWEGDPGKAALNMNLSCARADAFRDELLRLRVPAAQIATERFAHGADPASTLPPEEQRAVVLERRRKPVPPPVPPPSPGPPPQRVCGPSVDAEVTRAWSAARVAFDAMSFIDKFNNCRMLVQPITTSDTGELVLNQDAFDTWGLFQGSAGWTRVPPWHGSCGVPGSSGDLHDPFDPLHEDPSVCSNTVQLGGECWLSGTPNYGLFGIAMRACSDWTDTAGLLIGPLLGPLGMTLVEFHALFSLPSTAVLVGAYKILKGDNIIGPESWALKTWLGGPSARASGGNRATCGTTCGGPPPPSFLVVWEPNLPRSAMPNSPPYVP